jgi:glycosyltransferase involved in cell wall biosynthesis
MTLSVVVLTRNEAKNIERCLKSVQWADEIVVVDAESTDGTPEIAERLGARVIVHPWEGAGAQYAFGIAQARSDWVLILDADEEVTAELADAIRKVIADPKNPFVGYKVRRVNYALGRWLRYGGWQEWVLRLFLRERVTSRRRSIPASKWTGKLAFSLTLSATTWRPICGHGGNEVFGWRALKPMWNFCKGSASAVGQSLVAFGSFCGDLFSRVAFWMGGQAFMPACIASFT